MDEKLEKVSTAETTDHEDLMVSGSMWMTAGSLFSRLLGALYIIPWMAWIGAPDVGAAAHALYQVAYAPYAFFIAFATAGVPAAISKEVSYYNRIGHYDFSRRIYKQGLYLMLFTGLFSAIALYFLAPWFTGPIADKQAAVSVIRTLTPALLIIPSQAAIRGFIQGHNRMKEPAISQIIEQFMRVVFILIAVYMIRRVMDGTVQSAVSYSTFAAFIGAVFSLFYLVYSLNKMTTALDYAEEVTTNESEKESTRQVLFSIIKTAIPFIVISVGINLFQIVDQMTYSGLMHRFTNVSAEEVQLTYGIIQGNGFKLSTLLTSFGTSMAATSVPLISDLVARRDTKDVRFQFEKSIQLLLFIMFPATAGMIAVAEPLYTIFFGPLPMGTTVTRFFAIVSIFLALYLLLGNILQAVNVRRRSVYALIIGFLVKVISQPLTIYLAGAYGMLWSTLAGLVATIVLMMRLMHETISYSRKFLMRRSLFILILAGVMFVVTYGLQWGLGFVLNYSSKLQALLAIVVIAAVGVTTYGYLVLKTKLADRLLGEQAVVIRQKLRIKG